MRKLLDAASIDPRTLPIVVTVVLFAALFGFGSVMYTGFFSLQVLLDLLDRQRVPADRRDRHDVRDPVGRHRSVGRLGDRADDDRRRRRSSSACTGRCWVIVPLVLAMGTLFGAAMGALIQFFRLQPFIVTLAGMFLARGAVLPDHARSRSRSTTPPSTRSRGVACRLGSGVADGRRADRARDARRRRSSSRTSRASAATCMRSAATSARRC